MLKYIIVNKESFKNNFEEDMTMSMLDNINLFIATVDIDGTIKDLVKENTNSLINTMKRMGNIHLTKRGKFVLWLNRINMYFVKTGMLPTNSFMQNILLLVYSALLLKKYSEFKELYFEEYNNQNIFFDYAEEMIQNVVDKGLFVYLVTKNRQNKRMLELKENYIIKKTVRLIVGYKSEIKYNVYKSFLSNRLLRSNEILIIGDNFWDDILPGILLGTSVVWCNMYNSRLKRIIMNILKIFFKNLKDERELFMTK